MSGRLPSISSATVRIWIFGKLRPFIGELVTVTAVQRGAVHFDGPNTPRSWRTLDDFLRVYSPSPMTDAERIAALRRVLTALVNAVEDAMESPEEAASWARKGDMRKYLDDAAAALNEHAGHVVDADELARLTAIAVDALNPSTAVLVEEGAATEKEAATRDSWLLEMRGVVAEVLEAAGLQLEHGPRRQDP